MKVIISERNNEHIKFVLRDTNISYANAIRRVLISEVPTIAIDLVDIHKNNTVLPDEVLAHRLGLIPINCSASLKFKDECGCLDACSECSAIFELNEVNYEHRAKTILATKLESKSPGFSIDSTAIIAKLGINQSLHIRCVARKGIGSDHSKWSPVTAVQFEYDKQNKMQDTTYWFEEDVEKEWPGFCQGNIELDKKLDEIMMDVEVVGTENPTAVVVKGLEIIRRKLVDLALALEND